MLVTVCLAHVVGLLLVVQALLAVDERVALVGVFRHANDLRLNREQIGLLQLKPTRNGLAGLRRQRGTVVSLEEAAALGPLLVVAEALLAVLDVVDVLHHGLGECE